MKTIIITLLVFILGSAIAQEPGNWLKIPAKGKYIYISAAEMSVIVTGYEGNEIMIAAVPASVVKTPPAAAAGLTRILPPKVDGVSLNPEISETENHIRITLPAGNCREVMVKVPMDVGLQVVCSSGLPGSKVAVSNMKGGLTVGGSVDTIKLQNISGQFTVTQIGLISGKKNPGKIIISDIQWLPNVRPYIQDPNSSVANFAYHISSRYADIDISFPGDLKGNISLKSSSDNMGRAFIDPALNAEYDTMGAGPGIRSWYGYSVRLNNPNRNPNGLPIQISSTYGNIYLRKQAAKN